MNQSVLLGIFLIVALLIVHFSSRRRPLSEKAPLDVDNGLPVPWAGHASSLLSLTTLFSAFLGVFLLIGTYALVGILIGVIGGLLMVRRAIVVSECRTYETFLKSRRFSRSAWGHNALWTGLAFAQIGVAVSEMVLMREVAIRGFSLSFTHATSLTLSIALVVYFYCLIGGYDAVFRADILKFLGMVFMCTFLGILALASKGAHRPEATGQLPNFWAFGGHLRSFTDFAVGATMGIAGIVATPDTWKRVFVAVKHGRRGHRSFWVLVVAGCLPFILLSPVAFSLPLGSSINILPLDFLFGVGNSQAFLLALLLGMISVFMSSFDSALIAATHLLMVRPATRGIGFTGINLYRVVLCTLFLIIILASLALFTRNVNPYIVGNIMVGPFGILGGLIVATGILHEPLKKRFNAIFVLVAIVGWSIYMLNMVFGKNISSAGSTEQVESMPVGALLFALFVLVGFLMRDRR